MSVVVNLTEKLFNDEVVAVCLWLDLICVVTTATLAWCTGSGLSDVP